MIGFNRERPLIVCNRLRIAVQRRQGITANEQRFNMARLQCQNLITARDCLLLAPERPQHTCTRIERLNILGLTGKHQVVADDCLIELPRGIKDGRLVVERGHLVGFDRERPIKTLQCRFKAAEFDKDETEVGPRIRVGGLDVEKSRNQIERFGITGLLITDEPQQLPRLDVIRIAPKNLATAALGLRQAPLLMQGMRFGQQWCDGR